MYRIISYNPDTISIFQKNLSERPEFAEDIGLCTGVDYEMVGNTIDIEIITNYITKLMNRNIPHVSENELCNLIDNEIDEYEKDYDPPDSMTVECIETFYPGSAELLRIILIGLHRIHYGRRRHLVLWRKASKLRRIPSPDDRSISPDF